MRFWPLSAPAHTTKGIFPNLYAAHGANAHRLQRRVIRFASIVLSHAATESLHTVLVNKKCIYLWMA